MSEEKLCLRADFTALSMMKKLSKRTAGKQTAEQSVKNNNQSSVQLSTSFKMSKQLAQFFVSEFSKTSDSFKIKLEVLMFKFRPGSLSNESVHKVNLNDKNKDEINNEIKKVLKI